MSRKGLVVPFGVTLLLCTIVATGAAFAAPADTGRAAAPEQKSKLTEVVTVLHTVGRWSADLSAMADKRAKSDLVKNYAREMATTNADKDAKLMALAARSGIEVAPLDPKTEEGKSLLDRMKAETQLLSALEGDAFDKEYMTLVTNTQQSVIHFLEARRAAATDQDFRQFIENMITTVQSRLATAQDIMAKVYGDRI